MVRTKTTIRESSEGGDVIRMPKVEARTGLKRSAIYERLDPESPRYDPTFPKSFLLGGENTRAIGFIAEEIDAWVVAKAARRKGSNTAPPQSTQSLSADAKGIRESKSAPSRIQRKPKRNTLPAESDQASFALKGRESKFTLSSAEEIDWSDLDYVSYKISRDGKFVTLRYIDSTRQEFRKTLTFEEHEKWLESRSSSGFEVRGWAGFRKLEPGDISRAEYLKAIAAKQKVRMS